MISMILVVGPDEEDNEKFGNLMKEFRISAGLSRADAANILGVTSEYIRLIEHGKRTPAWGGMPKIFDAYNVKYDANELNSWIFGNAQVEFTSRIRKSRKKPGDPSPKRYYQSTNRSTLIGQIVESLTQSDTETLRYIHHILTRS